MCDNVEMSESFKVPEPVLEAKPLEPVIEGKPLVPSAIHDKSKTCEKDCSSKVNKSVSKKSPLVNVPLPYEEPAWSGSPPQHYSFEVIKNGTSVSVIDIKTSCFVFGRLDVCDVIFEHPSVSRYHAIVQYCSGDDTHLKGFYLYDLGSTHGTFLNKDKIKPKIYYKLKVGYIVKFGGSTRLHIFQGPEEQDEIVESNVAPVKAEVDQCDWGLTEDAEEEDDLSENPFALSTPNENLYLDDPKKTLRGWFEREGYELEFDVEEKGFKTFSCRIQLPIDNPTGEFVTIEASVSGKKKEAIVACALDACRTLDRYGLLRQSHHESRQHKKKRWEDDDFYDSDEDTYLDRTGTIEKKRELRKKMEKKSDVETYQSLEIKLKNVTEEITVIEEKLSAAVSNTMISCDGEQDSLEAYMSSLKDSANAPTDKVEKTKLKFRLSALEKERKNLEKLLEITRPTKLPPITKYPGMVGKRLKSKLNLPQSKPSVRPKKIKAEVQDNEEEIESDTEEKEGEKTNMVVEISEHEILDADEIEKDKKTKCEHNKRKQESDNSSSSKHSKENTVHSDSADIVKEKVIGPTIPIEMRERKKHVKKTKKDADVYSANNSEYSTWVPPTGQSGDGKTHLNAKFGY